MKYKLLLAFVVSLVALAVAEVGLRFTPFEAMLRPAYSFPQGYFQPDPEMGFDIKPDHPPVTHDFGELAYPIYSNSIGCFDRELDTEEAKRDGWILFVGDSFAWGYTRFEDKVGTIFEQALGRRVAKCGSSGMGTKQELIKARRVSESVGKPPELLVLLYTSNDFHDDLLFPNSIVVGGHRVQRTRWDPVAGRVEARSRERIEADYERFKHKKWTLKGWLRANSVVANLGNRVYERLWESRAKTAIVHDLDRALHPWVDQAEADHLATIVEFGRYASSHNTELLIATLVSPDHVKPLFSTINKSGAHHLDLSKAMTDVVGPDAMRRVVWRVDGHWNAKGNHLAGLLIAKTILEARLGASTKDVAEVEALIEPYRAWSR